MALIQLSRGLFAIVDGADAELVGQWKWYAHADRDGRTYACRSQAPRQMHRLILAAPQGMLTDHIAGDTLNNRRANLRLCTNAENLRNRKLGKNSTTGLKGVFRRPEGHFQAKIGFNGRCLHLGMFPTAEEAAAAYDTAAIRLHGEFARLNGV